eukprot:259999_1
MIGPSSEIQLFQLRLTALYIHHVSKWNLKKTEELYRYISTIGYHSIQVQYSMQSDDLKNNLEACEFYTIFDKESNFIADWTLRSSDISDNKPLPKTIDLPTGADNNPIIGIDFLIKHSGARAYCYYNDVSVSGIPITSSPTKYPTKYPTVLSKNPSVNPTTKTPTKYPTVNPTKFPTKYPTISPTIFPSKTPSKLPSIYPTQIPTINPADILITYNPTISPIMFPSI